MPHTFTAQSPQAEQALSRVALSPWGRRKWLARLGVAVAWPLATSWPGLAGAQAGNVGRVSTRADLAQVWRHEGGVLLLRHAATEAGLGDPPGFVVDRQGRLLARAGLAA